jgi:hypothetical protein
MADIALALTDALLLSDLTYPAIVQATEDNSLTRDGIAGIIRETLNDQGVFYSADDVNDAIQDGYDEIVAYTGCIENAVSLQFQSGLNYYDFYTLIPDYLGVVAIWNKSMKRWMIPVSLRELDDMRWDWERAVGSPYLFCPLNYRYVIIFPRMMSAGEMYVFYKAKANTLTGSDVLNIPPEICSEIMEHYLLADLHEQREEFTKAQMAYKTYWEEVQALIYRIRRFDQERLSRLGGFI